MYSSGSESDSEASPDSKSHSSRGESKSSKSSKSKLAVPKIPNPEEIAAAFGNTNTGGGGGFLPVPRSVQEKQKASSKPAVESVGSVVFMSLLSISVVQKHAILFASPLH